MTRSGLQLVTYSCKSWYHLVDRYLMFKCRRECEGGEERGLPLSCVMRRGRSPEYLHSALVGEKGGQEGQVADASIPMYGVDVQYQTWLLLGSLERLKAKT